jgi:hypothetical protein
MTPNDWYVPIIVLGIVVLIVAFSGRPKAEVDDSEDLATGADLIDRLQRTLGIGVVIESVEPAEAGASVTIRATLMYGTRATGVVATGESEADAWKALGRAAIAWRNADYQHVPMWPGAG